MRSPGSGCGTGRPRSTCSFRSTKPQRLRIPPRSHHLVEVLLDELADLSELMRLVRSWSRVLDLRPQPELCRSTIPRRTHMYVFWLSSNQVGLEEEKNVGADFVHYPGLLA